VADTNSRADRAALADLSDRCAHALALQSLNGLSSALTLFGIIAYKVQAERALHSNAKSKIEGRDWLASRLESPRAKMRRHCEISAERWQGGATSLRTARRMPNGG
jgi:hypothetical protein